MVEQDIEQIIESINRLQIIVTDTQRQITDLKRQADKIQRENKNTNQSSLDPELRIGDTVIILNPVRLRGNIRLSRNVRGEIKRFTQPYVVVRVRLPVSRFTGTEEYQEVKRAAHNLQKISITI